MKRAIFFALVLINAGLLVVLVMGSNSTPTAHAQEYVSQDYMMIAGRIDDDEEIVYITDLKTDRIVALEFDEAENELRPYRGVRLHRDFGRDQQALLSK
ncbi:MAG: hypothetical protein ACLFVU_14380 [Phycisphaerae bacterium]